MTGVLHQLLGVQVCSSLPEKDILPSLRSVLTIFMPGCACALLAYLGVFKCVGELDTYLDVPGSHF